MARMETVTTAIYFNPHIRAWLDRRTMVENKTINGIVRDLVRDKIKRVDPEAWERIEATLIAEATEPDKVTADGG